MGRPPTIQLQKLLETARAAFSQKGFAGTTLADIATELGVTPAAILRHTKSKQSLFLDAMTHPMHDELPPFFAALRGPGATSDPRAVLRGFAGDFLLFLDARIEEIMAVAMHLNAGLPTVLSGVIAGRRQILPVRALAAIEAYFRSCTKEGTMHAAHARATALVFIGSLQSYVIFHHVFRLAPGRVPRRRYIETLLDTLGSGVFTAAAKPARTSRSRSLS